MGLFAADTIQMRRLCLVHGIVRYTSWNDSMKQAEFVIWIQLRGQIGMG